MLIAALIHSPQGIYKEDSGADLGEVSNGCDVTDWIHLSQANVMSRKESITEIKKLIAFHWISAYTVDLLMCCLCLSKVKTRQWRETGNESPEKEPHHLQGKDVYSYKTSRPLLRQLTLSHLVTRTQYPKYKKTMICMPLDQAWGNPATEYFLSDSNSEKKKKLKAAREKTYKGTPTGLIFQHKFSVGVPWYISSAKKKNYHQEFSIWQDYHRELKTEFPRQAKTFLRESITTKPASQEMLKDLKEKRRGYTQK